MGYCFYCYLWSLRHSLVLDFGCSGNDGSGKLFCSCCFVVAIYFLVILSMNANANILSASS